MFRAKTLVITLLALSTALLWGCGSDDPMQPIPVIADMDEYLQNTMLWDDFSPPKGDDESPDGDMSTEQHVHEGSTFTCTTTPYSITRTPEKITVFNPDAEVLWVGALLQGDGYAKGIGSLAELPIRQRAPIDLSIDLLTDDVTRTVDSPDHNTVSEAVGELIQQASDSGHAAGSRMFFDKRSTYSLDQSSLKMGISARYMGTDVRAKLSYEQSVEEHTLTAYFVQQMFTVSMSQPQTPSELFSDSFTEAQLQKQFELGRIGPENPPVYISSIVYGRMLMMTMTSTHSVAEMQAALDASHESVGSGGSVNVEDKHLKVLSESKVQVATVGGSDVGVTELIRTGRLSEYFGHQAPLTTARPLSYQIRRVSDNLPALVAETTRYNLTSCAAEQTGIEYEVKLDKFTLIEDGCDIFTAPAVELYYDFDIHTLSGTADMATRPESQWVSLEHNGSHAITSSPANPYRVRMYKDGRGTMRVTGTAWDSDGNADDVLGTWDLKWGYGTSNGQRYFTRNGNNGCRIRLFVTIIAKAPLFD